MTAQPKSGEGSQIAAAIDEKFRLGHVVFLGYSMEERRRGVSPAAAVDVNFEHQLRVDINGRKQSFILAVNLDLFLVDGDPRWLDRRRVFLFVSEFVCPVPDRAERTIDTQPLPAATSLTDSPSE